MFYQAQIMLSNTAVFEKRRVANFENLAGDLFGIGELAVVAITACIYLYRLKLFQYAMVGKLFFIALPPATDDQPPLSERQPTIVNNMRAMRRFDLGQCAQLLQVCACLLPRRSRGYQHRQKI